ncbi:hypothetical protein GXW82_38515 [Streptacidiphilus sp. 4-A2]|nr:hypothetical protein [Streptacidiphilus sp. 4-A2]
MASTPGQLPALVTVPICSVCPRTPRDFAHRSQLVAVGPDPDTTPPSPGSSWSSGPRPAPPSRAGRPW